MEQNLTFEQLPNAVKILTNEVRELRYLLEQSYNQTACNPSDKLLSVGEAAEFLNLSSATVYTKVSRGELPFMKRSKRLYFSQSELMDYLKEGRKKTSNELEVEASSYLKSNKRK